MNTLVPQRFWRALRNDVSAQVKRVGFTTLALFCFGLLINNVNVKVNDEKWSGLFDGMFVVALVPFGLLFASLSWSDMHHPQGRFHYLMLPYSNLERFLSRFVLTAPLYYLYTCAVFTAFELAANALSFQLNGVTKPLLTPDSSTVRIATAVFFSLHALVFAGAIRFSNFVLPRTALTVLLLAVALALVANIAIHVFYPDYCGSLWSCNKPIPAGFLQQISPQTGMVVVTTIATLACLWVLYLAWLMLNDYEAQDGL
ncbi:MAG TPA: hypothetical protein VMH83_10685 [Candidatus Acidoferrum sp.]|nr:hypothetical protein [Candidatus Acidoferrum sp.]